MSPPRCTRCAAAAALRRPRTGQPLCRPCFVGAFEDETLRAVAAGRPTLSPGTTVAVAASGGKDSSVLSHVLARLSGRLGLRLLLLSVDEGISGYRDASLAAVRRHRGHLPLLLVSHEGLYGPVELPEVTEATKNLPEATKTSVNATKSSMKPPRNCQEATRSSMEAAGSRTEGSRSSTEGSRRPQGLARPVASAEAAPLPAVPRCKPLRHAYEKEIVLYAHFEGLDYVSTECVYAPHAYRGHARTLLKELEATRASAVAALGHSGRFLAVREQVATKALRACSQCGFAASQPLCKACVLLASLERGLPRLALGK
ncbi:CTU1 protein, partial [Nothocercus julius]|nr:CTU1 protein [Nothocercus julius]